MKDSKIALLVQELRQFLWMGRFSYWSGEASLWMVCYQRDLPRLVLGLNCLKFVNPSAMLDTIPIRMDKLIDCPMFCPIFKTVCPICLTVCPICCDFVQSAVICVQSAMSWDFLLSDQICFVESQWVPWVPFSGALSDSSDSSDQKTYFIKKSISPKNFLSFWQKNPFFLLHKKTFSFLFFFTKTKISLKNKVNSNCDEPQQLKLWWN